MVNTKIYKENIFYQFSRKIIILFFFYFFYFFLLVFIFLYLYLVYLFFCIFFIFLNFFEFFLLFYFIFKNLYIVRSTFTFHYRVQDLKRAQEHKFSGAQNPRTFNNLPTTAKMNKGKKPIRYLFLPNLKDSVKIP